jgi:hypothetical protein
MSSWRDAKLIKQWDNFAFLCLIAIWVALSEFCNGGRKVQSTLKRRKVNKKELVIMYPLDGDTGNDHQIRRMAAGMLTTQ